MYPNLNHTSFWQVYGDSLSVLGFLAFIGCIDRVSQAFAHLSDLRRVCTILTRKDQILPFISEEAMEGRMWLNVFSTSTIAELSGQNRNGMFRGSRSHSAILCPLSNQHCTTVLQVTEVLGTSTTPKS